MAPPRYQKSSTAKKDIASRPGLVDMRVQLREPGEEHKETIETACEAAAAGGVTTTVALPNTTPVIDDVSVVEFMHRRANDVGTVKIRCHRIGRTRGTKGEQLTEMGLLADADELLAGDGTRAVADTMVMRDERLVMRAVSP